MELIAAGHCTAHREKIKEIFPASFVEIEVGLRIDLE